LDTYFHLDVRARPPRWFCPDCMYGAVEDRAPVTSPPLGATREDALRLAARYEAGESLRDIGKAVKLGGRERVTHATIRDVLRFYDLWKPRPVKGPAPAPFCGKGHPMSGANLYVQPGTGKRRCRQCQNDRKKHGRRKETVAA
jgi:hypothetical protein